MPMKHHEVYSPMCEKKSTKYFVYLVSVGRLLLQLQQEKKTVYQRFDSTQITPIISDLVFEYFFLKSNNVTTCQDDFLPDLPCLRRKCN